MPGPKGSLTAAQYEIMAVVWAAPDDGLRVADIWQTIAQARAISRTTVLSQVDRLEKRGWLKRLPGDGTTRFQAALAKKDAAEQLAAGFVSDFFAGSTVEFLTALLGNNAFTLTRKDLDRLRKLIGQVRRQEDKP
jgi:BlaI family transcriptional regulator, penicillinase repressor